MNPNISSTQFFEERKQWSYWKHRILEKYLHVWISKLSSRYKTLAFVDAFAGPGRYQEGTPGSPIIAAQWNDHALCRDRAASVLVYACEADQAAAESLRETLAPWISLDPPRAFVFPTPFADAMPAILEATKEIPTFFFIDPFGTTEISFPKLRRLLEQPSRAATEVLVRIDPVMLSRYAGWVRRGGGDERRIHTTERFRQRLLEMNIDADTIAGSGVQPATSNLMDQYVAVFERRFKYVQLVPIRPDYFSSPKYYLIHATDSPDGCAKLNDVLSTTEDELFEETALNVAQGQGFLFAPVRTPRVTIQQAKEYVMRLFQTEPQLTFVEICAELALEFGPDLREKHHRRAVKELVEERRVSRTGEGSLQRTTMIRIPSAPEG